MIDLNDLRHSINRALRLGRYQIVVKAQGGEPVPASITLDLLERDDDLFDTDEPSRRQYGATITPEGDALVDTVTDDHGPAIPEQARKPFRFSDLAGPPAGDHHITSDGYKAFKIYEFALQDADGALTSKPATLGDVIHLHAPDIAAYCAADWVHVYDRVTRERRTLKRPEPDAVLTGLRDVAADLRGERGKEVFTPVADPMPPVGPLTSTEGLKAGDVLRVLSAFPEHEEGSLVSVDTVLADYKVEVRTNHGWLDVSRFAFVARPGVWMPWPGGENPIPGMKGKMRLRSGDEYELDGTEYWYHEDDEGDIIAYMVVDPSPVSSDT